MSKNKHTHIAPVYIHIKAVMQAVDQREGEREREREGYRLSYSFEDCLAGEWT